MSATPARRLPRWSEIRPLLNLRRPSLDRLGTRLRRASAVGDLRELARRRVPRAVFDYVDGAAEEEISLARARDAFRHVVFHPRILRDVSSVDLGRRLLGRDAALPLVLGPTGFTRMMHHEGERAVARAAARAGVPYTLSTMGTTSIEDVAGAAPHGRNWFQLYLWRDREASAELVARARDAGYDTLVLTVDTPVAGARLRDHRNGMTIPPMLGLRTIADMSRHPRWWADVLTTEPLAFASLTHWRGTVAELVGIMFDPSAGLDDLEWLRRTWDGSLVVKGIQHVQDARDVVEAGADAVVVSNHGGRQLDRAPTPLHLLPEIVDAVGSRAEVYLDTGVLTGADVVAAIGLGATGVFLGRAYLYGLMAGGERGVDRMFELLTAEMTRTLQLLGVPRLDDVGREHVTARPE
ncbi:alpha-hydroxy acid oxidase [Lentzea sp. NPDC051213]|uniref:alpha-hydroxy acid oxidase n=1 Tax=Lentzea sp. NPDC051213 TaxID=3364126 RepID=UPI0037BAA403